MKLKALTLWQPWAELIALGGKRIETRSWHTPHRGLLAIHAAKNTPRDEMEYAWSDPELLSFLVEHEKIHPSHLPSGAIVAVCDLVDCIRITKEFGAGLSALEFSAGNYEPGRYAWQLANVRRLQTPIPWRGRQQLFDVDIDMDRARYVAQECAA